ncbi:MAG: ComEA family DNA-binding protein [Anaeroplasmataceae bacterium]
MKRYILLCFSIFIILFSILMIYHNSIDYNISFINTNNHYYSIYLKGEVKYIGELNLPSNTKLGDFIYDYLTNYSDLNSFNKNEYIENNKVYNILYKDKLSINTASLKELKNLSDIGDVRANDIINGRPYTSIKELLEKNILTEGVYSKIENEITI